MLAQRTFVDPTQKQKAEKKGVMLRRQYAKQAARFKVEHPRCEACRILKTTDVHHRRGRGKYLLDESTWLAVCRTCHLWVHDHPREARELRLILPK